MGDSAAGAFFREQERSSLGANLASGEALAAWRAKHEGLWFGQELRDCFCLLEARLGQRGVGSGAGAVVEALKRRLEGLVGTLPLEKRLRLLEQSLPYACVGPLRSVPVHLLETLPNVPAKAAEALDALPEAAFRDLPKTIKLRLCAASPKRFEEFWRPLVERWRARVLHRAEARLLSSSQRKALEPGVSAALAELSATALDRCAKAACAEREPTLLVDVLLLQTGDTGLARARRLAAALDAPLAAGSWTEAAIAKVHSAALATPSDASELEAASAALLLSEPLAAQLAVQDLAEELEATVKRRQLPADSPRCALLLDLLTLADVAGGERRRSDRADELRSALPKVAVGLWRQKRTKRSRKHASHQPLLAALAGEEKPTTTATGLDGTAPAKKDDAFADLQLDEGDMPVAKRLAAHLAPHRTA